MHRECNIWSDKAPVATTIAFMRPELTRSGPNCAAELSMMLLYIQPWCFEAGRRCRGRCQSVDPGRATTPAAVG